MKSFDDVSLFCDKQSGQMVAAIVVAFRVFSAFFLAVATYLFSLGFTSN